MNSLVERCKKIAEEAHEGQFRKFGDDKGKPYVIHPQRIAATFSDPTLASIAWLHDVIEDTPLSGKDLYDKGVPADIVFSVKSVSKLDHENYLDFVLRAKNDKLGRLVKIADINDNMMSLKEGSLKDKYRLALHILEDV